MVRVGFEPTHPKIVDLKSTALDHSAIDAERVIKGNPYRNLIDNISIAKNMFQFFFINKMSNYFPI